MLCASSQGSLGMLTTTETFRKRGFGSFLVQKVVDEAVKQGVVPYVHIEDDNIQSQNFFKKRDTAIWINYYPTGNNERKLYM